MIKGAIAMVIAKCIPTPMDMLVRLYDLPDSGAAFERLRKQDIQIRRALAPEKHKIVAWVRENFAEGWASETEVAELADEVYASVSSTACITTAPQRCRAHGGMRLLSGNHPRYARTLTFITIME